MRQKRLGQAALFLAFCACGASMLNTAAIVVLQEKLNARIGSQVADTAHTLAYIINDLDVLKHRRPHVTNWIILFSWPKLLIELPSNVLNYVFWLLGVEPFERPQIPEWRAHERKGFA